MPQRLRLAGASRAGVSLSGALARAGYVGAGVWTPHPERPGRPEPADYGQYRMERAELGSPGADLLILAPRDDALAELTAELVPAAANLRTTGTLVLHLSGSLDLEVLAPLAAQGVATAALHPMRAFPRHDPEVDLGGCWFAMERGSAEVARLEALVAALGGRLVAVDSAGKGAHHLACSLASNALTVLFGAIDDLRQEAGIGAEGREAYADLARGALASWFELGDEALTGPWTRGDRGTVARHLALLRDRAELAALYRAAARLALAGRPDTPEAARLRAELDRLDRGAGGP